ncbi:hypothetical protein PP655_gp039 [Bacillus phage PBC4]|uniref:Uncharacterized protein n=1 Tax=Bacillus phage PBC4 TaxID=1675028 RepID=A0A1D6X877_9CAUD|nr:hypothetical protein PP655_gp039 [Bacillus phage PBC4]AKQ08231.1 hypothetical protein PBC4_039 [Bacillus phage PBC4]
MIKETLKVFLFIVLGLAAVVAAAFITFWIVIAVLGGVVWFGLLVGRIVFWSMVIIAVLLWVSYEIAKDEMKVKK